MLLLALEILTNPQVQPPSDRLADDNTRMMAVLGESMNVGSHPELAPYFERFEKIAARSSKTMAKIAENGSPSRIERVVFKPVAAPETLLFYLRLGPGLGLKVIKTRVEPETPVGRLPGSHPIHRETPALSKTP